MVRHRPPRKSCDGRAARRLLLPHRSGDRHRPRPPRKPGHRGQGRLISVQTPATGGSLTDDNLAAYADAEDYDVLENDDGVAFYTALAEETGGPVLEIACGTGRVPIPIALHGLDVTGLDVVPQMLDQARRKS